MKSLGSIPVGVGLSLTATLCGAQLIGYSYSSLHTETVAIGEKALHEQIEKLGGTYVGVAAGASSSQQLSDIDGLIGRGVKALIIRATDKDALGATLAKAKERGIPVIAYDRLIESPEVFYVSFDNREIGRMEARALLAVKPQGDYALIKGMPSDPNSDLLSQGQLEVLAEPIARGDVRIVGNEYTTNWDSLIARWNADAIIKKNGSKIDAVIASNDRLAEGVIQALESRDVKGAVVAGQDGDRDAMNRIALGTQVVSVWKDARELGKTVGTVSMALARGESVPDATIFDGGEKKVAVKALLLKAVPITSDRLNIVIDNGWVTKKDVCAHVELPAKTGPEVCK